MTEVELSEIAVSKSFAADDTDDQPLMAKTRPSAAPTASSASGDSLTDIPAYLPADQQPVSQPNDEPGTIAAKDEERAAEAERPWYRDQSVLVALLTSSCGAFLFSSFDEVSAPAAPLCQHLTAGVC